MRQALELGSVALILAHNHPSGTLKPSSADKQITQKLKSAAEALDLKVLDHLIITQQEYFSFADEQILWIRDNIPLVVEEILESL